MPKNQNPNPKRVKLISEKEKFEHRIGDSIFYYRRVPNSVAARFRDMHTNTGKLDAEAYALELLRYAITGWDNVLGEDDQPVEYDPELLPALPDQFLAELLQAVGDPWGSDVEKN